MKQQEAIEKLLRFFNAVLSRRESKKLICPNRRYKQVNDYSKNTHFRVFFESN
ncbi:hypothetical protein SAMN04487894_101114 [Niabella drilacis]|uniref:Uncharacterized protein n=1 Tax=Niabella drilacis (strain DSM 25811 / CCM 8410 / CCUG 62505 / LMG 26954 / E90) TaxID=1285928 RepID=A0A1G6I7Y3_NIADE|nr:hypothetical protein SAMN04487894_101114 [Niabella drilacis]